MLGQLDQVTPDNLTRLNRAAVRDVVPIRSLFERLKESGHALSNGISKRNEPRLAFIEEVCESALVLRPEHLEANGSPQVYFNFDLDGDEYFFASESPTKEADGRLRIDLPGTVFCAERRDLHREAPSKGNGRPTWVDVITDQGTELPARVIDWSLYGLGVAVDSGADVSVATVSRVRFADGKRAGETVGARICNRSEETGWTRIGLSLCEAAQGESVAVVRRDEIIQRSAVDRARGRIAFARVAIDEARRITAERLGFKRRERDVPTVEYPNDRGDPLRAIIDGYGDARGATAVVIPPAWGRTKETLMPLAATIVETFRRAGEPVRVVRFDGSHRRGESHIDPSCRESGHEYLRFTFSQAARDIDSTIDFLNSSPETTPSKTVLVTFSLAAIEGRRAVASDSENRINGWLSVVGMVDLQSALRTISGGIDYAYGLLKGVRFGHHELVGVLADMDHTGLDAIQNQMVFLEEARRDMAAIEVPVTWIHGRFDAWMDLKRVEDIMSYGATNRRRILEVPTGHQLRSSDEALQTFRLIAEEVSEIALGRKLPSSVPPLTDLEERRRAERDRMPRREVDLKAFWTDYLLGRDRRAGMRLLTATAAYRNFMETQIDMIEPRAGAKIADLGCGTGELALNLIRSPLDFGELEINAVDYVVDAVKGAKERIASTLPNPNVAVRTMVADLNLGTSDRVPLGDASHDAVLASLLISYLDDPSALLREAWRILKPGGRLVVSSMKRDADISRIFVEGVAELSPAPPEDLPEDAAHDFEAVATSFLNDASRLLDMEEDGRFRFWDAAELSELVSEAGFTVDDTALSFGEPPQAVIIKATRT